MITIGIDPNLFHFGGHFAIRWYSLIVVTAIGVVLWLATKEARRRGLDEDEFSNLAFLALPFGIVGARLFHVIDHWPDEYAANPIRALYVWEGGLAIWGAVIGALLAIGLWALLKRRSVGVIAGRDRPGRGAGHGYRPLRLHHHGRRHGRVQQAGQSASRTQTPARWSRSSASITCPRRFSRSS